jgi:hypothetical protein
MMYRVAEKSGTNGNYIYYLHYMLYMFTPTLYAFSEPLHHVYADFVSKMMEISDFNSMHHP